ncbi:MAG: amino acid permease [Acidobacteria bacterium]|nr:amino acid permease [Acidobacteriota bacterium]
MTPPEAAPTLRRELGKWDLTAIGVNQVIGSAIFLMPSQIAGLVGGWSIVAFGFGGLVSLCVGLCFAEVGSRFDRTGGPYLFTRVAFGRFVAFEVGWMQWLARTTAHASVINGLALALGFYWPAVRLGVPRASIIVGLTLALAFIQVRGIRESKWLVNALTIGKLVPLTVFIVIGAFYLQPSLIGPFPPITIDQASQATLLMIFTYGGYDVIPIPAGEATNPRRHVPFAMIATLLIVAAVMSLGQVVALGTLSNLGQSQTPLADASAVFLGGAGALMMGVGSILSMTGNLTGQILSGSRLVFALGENGDLPVFFGRIHSKYRTPANSIVFTAAVALALALSGSYVTMAAMSALVRIVTLSGTCAATLALRRPKYADRVQPATYTTPFGATVPIVGLIVMMLVAAAATRQQLIFGLYGMLAGAVLFFAASFRRSGTAAPAAGV